MERFSTHTPLPYCKGEGSETAPYVSADGTAGIAAALAGIAARGGKVFLPTARYDIRRPLVLDLPSTILAGETWAYNSDPNGVFETGFGTKIRLNGMSFPAFRVGETHTVGGAQICDIGVQGDIMGMDTRALFDRGNPARGAGLCFDAVRTDQCEFRKLSFCGLAVGVLATGNAELDACVFDGVNTDGCGVGICYTPRASFYTRFRHCIVADTPEYGFFGDGHGRTMHNIDISDTHFVRNGGAFSEGATQPAAVSFYGMNNCALRDSVIDAAGTFWYYDADATKNEQRQPIKATVPSLFVSGDCNRILNNSIQHSSDDAIRVAGNGNVLLSDIVDRDVVIEGENNTVSQLIFTRPEARLRLRGAACESTVILSVPTDKIVKEPR